MPCLSPNQDSSLQDCCDLWQYTLTGIRLQSFHATPPFCKSHFGLQVFSDSLNSFGAVPEAAEFLFRSGTMSAFQITRRVGLAFLFLLPPLSVSARVPKFSLPSETLAILDKIYSFDLDGATQAARHMQQEQSDHPLGFLLEAEAMWWRTWCTSADFKFGMTDARRRPKLESDRVSPRKCNFMPAWQKPLWRGCTGCALRIATQPAPASARVNISCAQRLWTPISPTPISVWAFTTIMWIP